MTASLFELDYVRIQRKHFESEYGDSIDAIKRVFNFDLEDLPVQHNQTFASLADDESTGLSFRLAGGNTITMSDLFQFSSQAGVLEGVNHPLSSFGDAIGLAKRVFPYFTGVPKGLAPVLKCSSFEPNSKDTWIAVPPICTVAKFESLTPAVDPEADSSSAVLIWFQDAFGIDLDERTRQQFQELDWSDFAVDGYF